VEQGRANNALLASQEAARLQRAVVDERLRFARELHDAIGSSLTVIVLQAGAARRLAATSPERAREVMGDVAAAARDGVAALAAEGDAPDVQALVERARAAGLVVDARVADVVRLDPTTRALVHRLVQEALTNVLRHAVGSRASLRLEVRDGQVELSVTNTAGTPGQHSPGSGRGLTGIRERVAAASGVVTCGPLPDGGFEVRARLPLPLPTRVAP
jgi:signal transduction histidine kinase